MTVIDGGARSQSSSARHRRWWPLVLLIVFGACTSAVVIPNVLTSMHRSKQRRTMADMRTIATAVEARATDFNEYPIVRSIDDLATLLVPTYIKTLPRVDGWGNRYRYEGWKEGDDKVPSRYAFISSARDGRFEKSSAREYASGVTSGFDKDIVYSNGNFVQYPDGDA